MYISCSVVSRAQAEASTWPPMKAMDRLTRQLGYPTTDAFQALVKRNRNVEVAAKWLNSLYKRAMTAAEGSAGDTSSSLANKSKAGEDEEWQVEDDVDHELMQEILAKARSTFAFQSHQFTHLTHSVHVIPGQIIFIPLYYTYIIL